MESLISNFKRFSALRAAALFRIGMALLLCLIACPSICQAQRTTAAGAQNVTAPIVAALRGHDFDEALQLCGAALKEFPNDSRLWTLRGMANAGKGSTKSALADYQHALKLAPDFLPALEGAAGIEYAQGSERAKPLLLRVLRQRPDDVTTHAMLAALDYREKRCNDAVPHFQSAVPLVDTQPQLLNEFASCLASLNRFDDAVPVLQRALALDPAHPNTRYNLALAEWNAGRADDALATLGPLIDSNGRDEDALTLAAELDESKNDTPRAVELLRQAIVANPKKADAYLQFSSLSLNHSSLQVGIDMLNTGISQIPGEPRLYLARAVLESEKGAFSKAMEDFDTVNRLDPNLRFAGVAEGLADSQRHKSKEALTSFRAAAKAHPNDAFTQYILASSLSEQQAAPGSDENAEAIAAARRAVALDPKMSNALNLLSTLELANGHPQRAIDYSQKALSIDPEDQQALYHLLLALRKTDRKDEVPAVLKRLIAARNAQAKGHTMRYKLEEASQPGTPATR